MKELWINFLQAIGQAWWVEIVTDNPRCTYYFGPFSTDSEAEMAKGGYVEDLETENALGIRVSIKRCKPERLTIDEDVSEPSGRGATPVFSGQL